MKQMSWLSSPWTSASPARSRARALHPLSARREERGTARAAPARAYKARMSDPFHVGGLFQQITARRAVVFDPCVMARRNPVHAESERPLEQDAEFDGPVALDAGVRRPAGHIRSANGATTHRPNASVASKTRCAMPSASAGRARVALGGPAARAGAASRRSPPARVGQEERRRRAVHAAAHGGHYSSAHAVCSRRHTVMI